MPVRRCWSTGLVVFGLVCAVRAGAAQATSPSVQTTPGDAADQHKKVAALLEVHRQEYLACGNILDLPKAPSPGKSKPTLAEATKNLEASTRRVNAMSDILECEKRIIDAARPELFQETGLPQPLMDEAIKEWRTAVFESQKSPKPKEPEKK